MKRMQIRGWLALVALIAAWSGVIGSGDVYSGFLGCRFSNSVCQEDEECIDDRLFGTCQKAGKQKKDYYQYYLDQQTLQALGDDIERLIANGYTWDNLYTQCVLGNILLAFRRGSDFDKYWCDRRAGPSGHSQQQQQSLTEQTYRFLEKFFQEYYDQLMNAKIEAEEEEALDPQVEYEDASIENPNDISGPLDKKTEFLKVHKYFVDDKADPPMDEEDIYPDSSDKSLLDSSMLFNSDEQRGSSYDQLLEQLQPQDLAYLKSYLQDLSDDVPDERDEEIAESVGDELQSNLDQLGYVWDDKMGRASLPVSADELVGEEDVPQLRADYKDETIGSEDVPQGGEEYKDNLRAMTPGDAKLIGDLIQERMSVSDLTDDEIARLTKYVDSMLRGLEKMKENPTELDSDDSSASERGVLKEEEVKRTGGVHLAVKKEQLNKAVLENPSGNAYIRVEVAPNEKKQVPMAEQAKPTAPAAEVENLQKDPHDHHFEDSMVNTHTPGPKYGILDANYAYLRVRPDTNDLDKANILVQELERILGLPSGSFDPIHVLDGIITFRINPNDLGLNASVVANQAMAHAEELKNKTDLTIVTAGIGKENKISVLETQDSINGPKYFVLTFVLCGCIAGIVLVVIALYIIRRHSRSKEKLAQLANAGDGTEASKDYQDLCRQRMQGKSSEKPEPLNAAQRVGSVSTSEARSPSSRSSTSSWSEEPVTSNMDISTGHIVLSYMEDHLKNKDRLDQEWEALCAYEAEPNSMNVGAESSNMRKNRYSDVLPYDHSRVILSNSTNVSGSDYVNASTITDHDPRNPAYIATQGPLPHTVADFWQMVWEQGSVVIVMLTKLTENGVAMCHRYWPEEGSDLYHIYEVHLVSEHIWCDDYLVRSFYLKNLQTNETRTVTQFHFLTWLDLGVPTSAKALLDFRRKVNKSYRGRSCPIVVHCSDGVGRSGTYTLIDMVLNRMSKGAKEIDIAATLEHIRDQRMNMVKTKEQFEFALASVAEEVHAILKALPQ